MDVPVVTLLDDFLLGIAFHQVVWSVGDLLIFKCEGMVGVGMVSVHM